MNLTSLRLLPNPVIVDCGCNEGQWLDHVLPQLAGTPRVIAIDMLWPEARVCQARHPQATVLNVALDACAGELIARRHECSQSSSLLPMTALHDKVWGSPTHEPVSLLQVQTVSLDALMRLLMVEHVDLLKLDLQGYEIQALKGAEYTLSVTDHVISEVSWVELYEGQVLFPELDVFLQRSGFKRRMFYDLKTEDGDNVCGDALWSRRK